MPTYEYECPRCPRVFEVKQRISEPALDTCDRCGGPIHRLLSAAPFILKGGGWYTSEYPSESRKKAMSAESGAKESTPKDAPPKDAPPKDSGKAESKPAATPSSEAKSSTGPAPASPPSSGGTPPKESGGSSSSA